MTLQTPLRNAGRLYKMYATRLEKLGISTLEDFLLHIPNRYEDYSIISSIANIQEGETVTIQGQVLDSKSNYLRGNKIKTMQKVIVTDGTGTIDLVWFNQPFLTKTITNNSTIAVSGRVQRSGRNLSMSSPEYELISDDSNTIHTGRLIPIYPETKGISSKWLRRQVHKLLIQHQNEFTEFLPDKLLKKEQLLSYDEAIRNIHFPKDLELAEKARERLAFDEFFFMQLAAKERRTSWQKKLYRQPFAIDKQKIDKLIASLPFTLTQAQQKSIDEMLSDMSKDKPMNRLLQGDVGSGKTVVASIGIYTSYLNGHQSVFMAPTEILAQQHFKTIDNFLSPFGIRVALVTGNKKLGIRNQESGIKEKTKKEKNSHNSSFIIPDSSFDVLVGTHAVLSEKIQFTNLGLVIIDEQQRFGVSQRGLIRQKGENPHLLTMTATPIPRTVALTMYGDLDLSYLSEMPHGRKRVKTWLVPPEKRNPAYEWIRTQIKETDSQVFIICPFIEESENMQTVKAATKEFEKLQKEIYPDLRLGMLHGKLKAKEKDTVLQEFRDRKFDILVATPVVEVGIDIPNATVIMIEAAERFGLSQLHQLRGRVGRGDKQSYCLLFTGTENGKTSERLKSLETVYSGAELAEIDLKLRGPGTLYGTLQHGVPKLKVASFSDTTLIQRAKYAADEIFSELSSYPQLEEKLKLTTVEAISPD